MRLSLKVIFTHLAALVLGWACVDRMMDQEKVQAPAPTLPVKTKTGERQAGGKGNQTASGVLDAWTSNTPDRALVKRLEHESVAELADSIWAEFFIIHEDGSVSTISRVASGKNLELVERFRGLLLAEPEGLLQWFVALPDEKRGCLAMLLGNRSFRSAIPDDQLAAWGNLPGAGSSIAMERGIRVGEAGDIAGLNQMLADAVGNALQSHGLFNAISQWPVDRIDALIGKLDFRSSTVQLGVMELVGRVPQEKRLRFIEELTSAADGIPEFAPLQASLAMKGTGMDLERRNSMIKLNVTSEQANVATAFINSDIKNLFSDTALPEGESLSGSLEKVRKGEMEADELLNEVVSRLGKLAEGNDEMVREAVFRQLAKIAPDKAVTLMGGMPAKKLQDKAFALGLDPAGFESAASILRAREPEVSNDLHSRFSGWGHKSFEGLARYGDAYVSWAMSMPRSLERDLVLSSIAIHLEKEDPQWAARLRAEKSFQKGWKPGMK
jgi:hypothetical protein